MEQRAEEDREQELEAEEERTLEQWTGDKRVTGVGERDRVAASFVVRGTEEGVAHETEAVDRRTED